MDGITVKMGESIGGFGGLKTNFESTKAASNEQGTEAAKQNPGQIAQAGLDESRTAQLQMMGLGQKVDTTA